MKAGLAQSNVLMDDREPIPVACPDCGMRAEVRLEPSGPQTYITDTITKCKRARRGMDVVGCRGLKSSCGRSRPYDPTSTNNQANITANSRMLPSVIGGPGG